MQRLGPYLKLLFSILVMGLVLWRSHPEQIGPALARADVRLLLAAVLLWTLIQTLNVFKWWLLNRAQGMAVPFRRLHDVYYMGMFFNTFLPSGFGGDALRAYELTRFTQQGGSSTTSVLVDRLTSLYALVLLGTLALLLAPHELQQVPLYVVLLLDALGAAGFAFLLQPKWVQAFSDLPFLQNKPLAKRFMSEAAAASTGLRSNLSSLWLSLAIALAYQFLNVAMHFLLIRALGLPVSFTYTAVFLPILVLAASMPVSINGLGIREGGFVFFLGRVGVDQAAAVTVGLLSLSMLLLSGLWGAMVYVNLGKQGLSPTQAPSQRAR